jgi:hypothetical protein
MKKLLYLLLLTGCAGSVPNAPVVSPTGQRCEVEVCKTTGCTASVKDTLLGHRWEVNRANRREFSSPIPIDPNDHFGHPYP